MCGFFLEVVQFVQGDLRITFFFSAPADVMEADQIDIFAAAVLCNLKQVEDTEEAGLACQFRSDVGKAYGLDGVNFDGTFVHAVAFAYGHARRDPEANRAGDFAAADSFAKAFGEDHEGKVAREEGHDVSRPYMRKIEKPGAGGDEDMACRDSD